MRGCIADRWWQFQALSHTGLATSSLSSVLIKQYLLVRLPFKLSFDLLMAASARRGCSIYTAVMAMLAFSLLNRDSIRLLHHSF